MNATTAYTADHRSTLPEYRNWSPTGADIKGLNAGEHASWFVAPCILTRDADHLEASNYAAVAALLAEVDADGNDHQTLDFGHWACGHFEIIVVRPGSNAHRVAVECEMRLADYPALDDEDLSMREHEAQFDDCLDSLNRLTIQDATGPLNDDQLNALADAVCCNASDSESLDSDDITEALRKLGWRWDDATETWFAVPGTKFSR